MDVFVARQPILDLSKRTCGYELLFRDGTSNAFPDNIDGETATSKILSNSFFSIGMDQMTWGKKAFINFTHETLVKKIPLMFPNEKITVEVLEDVEPDAQIISACAELKEKGYTLALDDFCYRLGVESLVALANIIKLDFLATPMDEIRHILERFLQYNPVYLAEKVETYEDFKSAVNMGFKYFQGYFFSKPEVLKGKDIAPSKLTLLQILAEVNKEEFNFVKLEKLIVQDVSLSYKLLRYINSAYFRRVKEITSIKHAILMLGEKEVRRFVSLMGVATIADNKPDELIRASIIRARMCEQLAKHSSSDVDHSELFTLGLFSFIDAIMDDDIGHLMEQLPLSSGIKEALAHGQGPLVSFLEMVNAYDNGEWEKAHHTAEHIGVDPEIIPELYMDAIGWADSLT